MGINPDQNWIDWLHGRVHVMYWLFHFIFGNVVKNQTCELKSHARTWFQTELQLCKRLENLNFEIMHMVLFALQQLHYIPSQTHRIFYRALEGVSECNSGFNHAFEFLSKTMVRQFQKYSVDYLLVVLPTYPSLIMFKSALTIPLRKFLTFSVYYLFILNE